MTTAELPGAVTIVEPSSAATPPRQPAVPQRVAVERDAREASLRPFPRPGRGWWLLAGVLAAVVAVGLYSWTVQLREGMAVAGYNDHAFWAVYIADVVTFIGVSYGGAVISAILRLTGATWRAPLARLAEGTAVVTVLVGAAFIVPHLARPDRLWEMVTRPNLSSPVFWDFVAISTYAVGSIVFFALPLVADFAILHRDDRPALGRRARLYGAVSRGWVGAPRQRAVLSGALGLIAIMIIPLAVSVHSVLSWAFALVSRPWWHESIWAPSFVVAALYSGVALVILVVAAFRRAYGLHRFITERHFVRLGFIMATFAATYLYLTFADILPDAYVGEPGTVAVFHELLAGRYAMWFWTFIVAAGVIPLLLVAIRRTRTVTGMVVASALVVPAMWLKRMLMVLVPSTYDRVTGSFGAYHFTFVSVSITLAGAAAIPLLLMLLFRVVPLLSIEECAELSGGPGAATVPVENTPAPLDSVTPVRAAPARRLGSRLPFRSAGTVGMVALFAGGSLFAGAAPARAAVAAHTPPVPAATITVTGTDTANGVHLTATLTDSRHVPMAGATVAFYERTTEFGPSGQLILAGRSTTDPTGTATFTDRPAQAGSQQFAAGYAGGPAAAKATAIITVAVAVGHPTYVPTPPKPFAGAGRVLVVVLMVAVLLILATLLIQLERVRRVCRAGA